MLKLTKIEYEWIVPDSGSSFRMIEVDETANRFYWHAHPEYEIAYIQKGNGKQQIGNNTFNFASGELVFIGPNIPHLGFGYGNEYSKAHKEIVIQLKNDFLGEKFLNAPECESLKVLFEHAKNGICFKGNAKLRIGKQIEKLVKLEGFERLIALLSILQDMANTKEYDFLLNSGHQMDVRQRDSERIDKIMNYVEKNFKKEIRIEQIADLVSLTEPSFCRFFKQVMHMTFSDFLNEYRVSRSKMMLLEDNNISEVCFASGFNSLSHFDKTFKKITGKNPSEYRKEHLF
jgi:AraC-like DNA-binding protein/quercetin dioxygenase-like cupin family protein